MWDYDKLFAENNVIELKALHNDKIFIRGISDECHWGETNRVDWHSFKNKELKVSGFKIQYIIHLDEYGNVVERLFDRETDMPKPMPELETGMFVLVDTWGGAKLGFVDAEHNRVIYQDSGYDYINDDDINGRGIFSEIMAVYDKDTCAFNFCTKDNLIWSKLNSN